MSMGNFSCSSYVDKSEKQFTYLFRLTVETPAELSPAHQRVSDLNFPAVSCAQLLHDSQTQSTATCVDIARRFQPIKWLENSPRSDSGMPGPLSLTTISESLSETATRSAYLSPLPTRLLSTRENAFGARSSVTPSLWNKQIRYLVQRY